MNVKNQLIEELNVVALLCNLPRKGLVTGQVGTVVNVFSDKEVEVEFVTPGGETFALAVIPVDQLLVLHYSPVAA